jgi:hypothetical protein
MKFVSAFLISCVLLATGAVAQSNAYNSAGEHIIAVGQLRGNDWV